MTSQYNPFDPEVLADPYPYYHRDRAEDPVRPSDLIPGGGVWLLMRYADSESVLRSGRFSADRSQAAFNQQAQNDDHVDPGPLERAQTMLTADPPDHTRLRTLVSKAFSPSAVEVMRPHIQEIVDDLLDEVQGKGCMDLIADLAYPLPVIVIAEMLGIPPGDRDQFKKWSADIAMTLDPIVPPDALARAQQSALELEEYFRGVADERRRNPKSDLVSALIEAEQEGDRLTEDELYATLMLLLIAGNETTTNLIGNGALALLRHPDQLQMLRDDPALIESAVEELLRYDSPVQATGRVALEKMEIGGKNIEKGHMLVTHLGAANRDPEKFPDPDRLDIRRQDNRHLAFGQGPHFCLGAPLARAEGQIAISTLLRRFHRLRLDIEAPEWRPTIILRGLKALPVRF